MSWMTKYDGMTLVEILDARQKEAEQGDWVPACGGTELPFVSRNRIRMLYVYQPSTGKHAYLNLDSDLIMTDEEAAFALGV
jgi:hypothetical protein